MAVAPVPAVYKGTPVTLNYIAQMPYAQQLGVQENLKFMPEPNFFKFMDVAITPVISFPQDLVYEKALKDSLVYEFWTMYLTVRNQEMGQRGLNPSNPSDLQAFEAYKEEYQTERAKQTQDDTTLQAQSLLNDIVVDVRLDIESRYRSLAKMPNPDDEFKRASMLRVLLDNGEFFVANQFVEAMEIANPSLIPLFVPGAPPLPQTPETTQTMSGHALLYKKRS